MKISKKIIALILSLTMLIGLFTFTTGAIEAQQEWVEKIGRSFWSQKAL